MRSSFKDFVEGFGRAIDLGDHLTEFSYFEDDGAAVASDWMAVGADLLITIESHAGEVRDRIESGR